MNYPGNSSFTRSVKGKVVIAFLAGCIALGLAWIVSQTAFREMLHTVKQLSEPNEKLRIVNALFRDITQLDQLQKRQALLQANSYKTFLDESKSLRQTMDSLQELYSDNPEQVIRLDSMKRLLLERDKLFLNYLQVRQGLVNNNDLTKQIQTLSQLILNYAPQIDSTVITTEKKVSTTFIYPSDSAAAASNEEKVEAPSVKSGFFARLFGKKKPEPQPSEETEQPRQTPTRMVTEEVNVKIDTLALAKQDSIMWEVEKAMQDYEKERRLQSSRFVNREIELANASNVLTSQMLSILQEVEKEVVKQEAQNNIQARNVVSTSVMRISAIMGVFLLLMAILVYLILTDIAKSNAYRQQLEIAKEEAEYHGMAKQRFLANMSHEIRTPLQSIIGYADLLRQQDKPSKRHIEAIFHSSEHLLHIVNEVLDYSRIISGKFTFERRDFDLHQLLEEVITVMRPQAEKKLLPLELHNNVAGNGFITGDPFRLKQMLYNLLGNAIKFTEKGHVGLTVDEAPGEEAGTTLLTFTISDTGSGITPKDVRRIFNQFEQAGESSHQNGTGLGLSIVKALTEAQNGTIEVTSEPGAGSRFAVQLPFVRALSVPVQQYTESSPASSRFTGKVWVVDDDPFILHLCAAIFEKHGISHTCFQLPEVLLNTPWDDNVSLILADMRMPGLNGAELCKRLRTQIPEHVKIFALTAQALPEEREAVLQEGFDGLVMKPFRESEILALLDDHTLLQDEDFYDYENEQDEDDIDLAALEKLTFGDKALLQKVLERFVTDNRNDLELLCTAAKEVDMEQISLLLHRMAGRTAQIGAGELAARMRMLEIALQRDTVQPGDAIAEVNTLTEGIKALLDKIANLTIPQSGTSPSFYKASYDQY
ncbi:ATP-binding protein [uncultured Chitinophaga sp.]|jgi:Signal transduction histidine kinase|uniref:ATP-binding protein n=1 Tax=uncultured Chitinophaga sp. TaxID=339340 RepID=UPI002615237D|nr:ATP-binding protein [uncultured Chitinophaga sp.]